jgi:hypothetical protein
MKKFITDNIAWLLIAFAVIAIAALVLAIRHQKLLGKPAETTNGNSATVETPVAEPDPNRETGKTN